MKKTKVEEVELTRGLATLPYLNTLAIPSIVYRAVDYSYHLHTNPITAASMEYPMKSVMLLVLGTVRPRAFQRVLLVMRQHSSAATNVPITMSPECHPHDALSILVALFCFCLLRGPVAFSGFNHCVDNIRSLQEYSSKPLRNLHADERLNPRLRESRSDQSNRLTCGYAGVE